MKKLGEFLTSPDVMLTVNGELSGPRCFMFVLLCFVALVALWYLQLELTNYSLYRKVDDARRLLKELRCAERNLLNFRRAVEKKKEGKDDVSTED